jgi:TP901 family phage tail tape measure protein
VPVLDTLAVHLKLQDAAFRTGMAANKGIFAAAERAFVGGAKRIGAALETGLKVGAAAGGAGLGFAIKTAIDLESQIGQVRKTTGLAGGDLKDFTDQVKDLSRSLPGASVEDLFSAASEGGRQGIQDPAALLEYTRAIGMIKVALSDIPIEESASSIGGLLTNYGLGTEKALGLASAINKLDDSSNAAGQDIMQGALAFSQMGELAGLAAHEGLALSAALLESKMSAENAGGAVSHILQKVATDQDRLAKLAGVSSQEYKAALEQGPLIALDKVVGGIKNLRETQGSAAAQLAIKDAGIVDLQDSQALLSLAQNWGGLAEKIAVAQEEMASGASIRKEVGISAEMTSNQLGLLWNQITLAADAVGSKFLPGLKALAKHLGAAADRFAAWAEGGSLDWIAQLGVDLADMFGGALEDWPGTIDLLGKLFDSLFARINVGIQKIRASLLESLADFQEQIPGGWAGDAKGTRLDAKIGVKSAENNQRKADAELGFAFSRQVTIGRNARSAIEVKRAAEIAGPPQPAPPPPINAIIEAEMQERDRAFKEGHGNARRKAPNPDEFENDPEFQLYLQGMGAEIQHYNFRMDGLRSKAGEEMARLGEEQQERNASLMERQYSVRSGSADDFASAIQAGVGKTGDIQKEIRDYNKRTAEAMERLMQEWAAIQLE